ncbi:hypothetical protein KBK24_0121685 [Burkholderia sp. K24]|nr:hypothetical protein KBK24_0121685 [Burkholderia sp. K24]
MSVYLVGYDLTKKQIQQYDNLFAAIKAYGTWWHGLDSTWMVVSSDTAAQIRDNLQRHMHSDDRLLVIRVSGESAWTTSFSSEAQDWLRQQLPNA